MRKSKYLDDSGILGVLAKAFGVFLDTGSRSNAKLKVLHSAIAADLLKRLGEGYSVYSLGFGRGGNITSLEDTMTRRWI